MTFSEGGFYFMLTPGLVAYLAPTFAHMSLILLAAKSQFPVVFDFIHIYD